MTQTIIIGAGPAGLTSAHILNKNNKENLILEKDSEVGGLSRTINYKGSRFDLGGHRFWTKNEEVDKFVKNLMEGELIVVPRTSRILLNKRFFNYPLTPLNALFGMGVFKSFRIVGDYGLVKLKGLISPRPDISFEDWIVNRFGKTMYLAYFKHYTEKVWGIPCTEISADWAAQRIKGMSLRAAIKDAFFRSKKSPKTLVKEFTFPRLGIGRLSDKLAEPLNNLKLSTTVINVKHENNKIQSLTYLEGGKKKTVDIENLISSMPITELVKALDPQPPQEIIDHANKLTFINEIFIFLVVDKESVTDDSWLYFPDRDISFVRIHEPKNWSKDMALPGKTSLVVEYICKENTEMWNEKDENLTEHVLRDLEKINFLNRSEVSDSCVVRTHKTYPIYDIGYTDHINALKNYFKNFTNLQLIGRNGTFKYNNMDHSIEMGLKAAQNLMGANHDLDKIGQEQEYFEQKT